MGGKAEGQRTRARGLSTWLAAGLLAGAIVTEPDGQIGASLATSPPDGRMGVMLLVAPSLAASPIPGLESGGDATVTRQERWRADEVERVLDANVVKLRSSGVVRLAGAVTPTLGLPECFRYTPSAHIRRALPARTRVEVELTDAGSRRLGLIRLRGRAGEPQATTVNEALVAGGWAKATLLGVEEAFGETLVSAQTSARARNAGLWISCDTLPPAVEAQYEEVARVAPEAERVITLRPESTAAAITPQGSVFELRGDRCGEYAYYEDAKRAFDAAPTALARMDSDGDGVPCAALPHRPEIERRQLKAPRQASGPALRREIEDGARAASRRSI
ncbi:hypothetical protein T492DRAFT_998410 [Pavlovales sp. CCMP2436]|nr:hypothetical protein T492DRAFT_998410 [Pavlovales sp. CCMP2436]